MPEFHIHPGQVWGDNRGNGFGRELVVEMENPSYAYVRSDSGRRSRIQIRRLRQGLVYYLKHEAPAHYVEVPSSSRPDLIHKVWTGDTFSPAHCPCENFRWAERTPGEVYLCRHLKLVFERNLE